MFPVTGETHCEFPWHEDIMHPCDFSTELLDMALPESPLPQAVRENTKRVIINDLIRLFMFSLHGSPENWYHTV
jgi:hypothetical protein